MKASEYQTWLANQRPSSISMSALDAETRSLMFGVQLGHGGERVHLFQHQGKLHLVRFRPPTPQERQEHGCDAIVSAEHIGKTLQSSLLTGNERWLSEVCDFEFCSILDMSGVPLELMPHRGARDLAALAAQKRLAGYSHVPELETDTDFKAIVLPDVGYPVD
jgi:hypothetical protein